MAKIIILSGIPCSGKSTFAKKIRNHTIISRDTIRESNSFIQPYIYCNYNEKKVTEIFNELLKFAIKNNENIIIDNTNCKTVYLDGLIKDIKKNYPDYIINVLFFDISLIKAYYRNIIRYYKTGKWIPLKVLNNFYKHYKNINQKYYDEYILHIRHSLQS